MNIFICGGSGYLAGSLAKELSINYNVIVGTRFPKKIVNYKKKNKNKENKLFIYKIFNKII